MKCISRKAFEIEVQTLKAQDGKALGLVLAGGFHRFFWGVIFSSSLNWLKALQSEIWSQKNFWYMDFE